MLVSDIFASFANWSMIFNTIFVGDVMTTLISILTVSTSVGFVLYLFERA